MKVSKELEERRRELEESRPIGYCPYCGDDMRNKGTMTERRPNGDTTCGSCGRKSPTRDWYISTDSNPLYAEAREDAEDIAAAKATEGEPSIPMDVALKVIEANDRYEAMRTTALYLWGLLDDIDTFSDAYKDSYEALAKATYRKQRQRFNVGSSDGYTIELHGMEAFSTTRIPETFEPPMYGPAEIAPEEATPTDYLFAAMLDYLAKDEKDRQFENSWAETVEATMPMVAGIRKEHLIKDCPPCMGLIEFEDFAKKAWDGLLRPEDMMACGFGAWNEPPGPPDVIENENGELEEVPQEPDPFKGARLWLCPVNWADNLPKHFKFCTIFGHMASISEGLSKDSRMGYLAYGILANHPEDKHP